MNSISRKFMSAISNVVFICAVIVLLFYGITICLNIKPAVIVSGSMEPTIKTGSIVLIDMKDRDAVERDIIAYKSGSIFVAHRVKEVTDEGYITKGDANEMSDPGVLKKNDLVGRVVMWVPYAGYAVKFMTSLPVIIVCIMLILIVLILQLARGKEESDEQNENSNGSCRTAS